MNERAHSRWIDGMDLIKDCSGRLFFRSLIHVLACIEVLGVEEKSRDKGAREEGEQKRDSNRALNREEAREGSPRMDAGERMSSMTAWKCAAHIVDEILEVLIRSSSSSGGSLCLSDGRLYSSPSSYRSQRGGAFHHPKNQDLRAQNLPYHDKFDFDDDLCFVVGGNEGAVRSACTHRDQKRNGNTFGANCSGTKKGGVGGKRRDRKGKRSADFDKRNERRPLHKCAEWVSQAKFSECTLLLSFRQLFHSPSLSLSFSLSVSLIISFLFRCFILSLLVLTPLLLTTFFVLLSYHRCHILRPPIKRPCHVNHFF